jgi:DNA-binding NarL/FixJ family response regulator
MKTFIIADNQDITKAGMMFLLSNEKETDNIVEAANKGELVRQLLQKPDAIVILDYTLFDMTGANDLLILHERFKEAVWLLFSDDLSVSLLKQILFTDNSFSVVTKESSREEITAAIHCAIHGERFICNYVSNQLLSDAAHPAASAAQSKAEEEARRLTPSERAVLKEVAMGKTTKEIAAEKNLSFHTVNSHRKNIFRKLGVNNVHEATKYAMRAGIIDPTEYYI